MPSAKPADASRLNFPLQMVIVIVGTVVAAAGTVWTIESGLRSDIRNISTVMEAQAETVKVQRELDRVQMERVAEKQQANINALQTSVDTIEKTQQLMKIEFQQFKESMLSMGRR